MDTEGRLPQHQRVAALEEALAALSEALGPSGDALAARSDGPALPVLLVVGAARSGSTLLLQWLQHSGAFAVPTNALSRFYRAPAVGALVQRVLLDSAFDFNGELHPTVDPAGSDGNDRYASALGKTRGPLAPHEFWYFWGRFFPFGDRPALSAAQLAAVDAPRFRAELGAWEAAEGRPLALKALNASWITPWLSTALPTAVFLHLKRDPLDTMASLLAARERFSGDRSRWYSFKPPEYSALAGQRPEVQVAGQVLALHRRLDRDLATLPVERVVKQSYAELCASPRAVWARLRARMGGLGLALPVDHPGPERFVRRPASDRARLRAALDEAAAVLDAASPA